MIGRLRRIPRRLDGSETRRGTLTVWYLVSALAVLLIPTPLRLGAPWWTLPPEVLLQSWVWAASFLGFAFVLTAMATRARGVSSLGALALGAAWALSTYTFLALQTTAYFSGWVVVLSTSLGFSLGVLPYYLGRRLRFAPGVLAVSTALVAGVSGHRMPPREHMVETVTYPTSLYTVSQTTFRNVVDSGPVRGGGIEAIGESFVLVTGDGRFYSLAWDSIGTNLRVHRLPLTAPLNRAAYLAYDPTPPSNRLRVTDLVLDTSATPPKVYVAHEYWKAEERCFTIRISTAPLPEPSVQPDAPPAWRTVFETHPCLPHFNDWETGGRLAWTESRSLLLTVGDVGLDGVGEPLAASQDTSNSYGKILLIHPTGTSEIFSIGHRNPQGLVIATDGQIWSTEHGPQGGDEVNLIRRGGNYGWPLATYGTEYGHDYWPLAPDGRNHGEYREPMYVFATGVAPSNLIQVHQTQFPRWSGDFLVGSLGGLTLFRMRTRDTQVTLLEPIQINRRIRDLAEGKDGRIILWTGQRDVIVLARARGGEAERAVQSCRRCHGLDLNGTVAGPSLRGLFDRNIATAPGFSYSLALRRLGGRWTDKGLDSFLRDPETFAPGSSMAFSIPDSLVRRAVIEYLKKGGSGSVGR